MTRFVARYEPFTNGQYCVIDTEGGGPQGVWAAGPMPEAQARADAAIRNRITDATARAPQSIEDAWTAPLS